MAGIELGKRAVWLRVGAGLASMAGDGRLWNEPAAVRKAILELLGVFPVNHVEIELAAVRAGSPDEKAWESLLAASGDWKALLAELWSAIGDALGGRATWGIALPDPRRLAPAGEAPEKTMLKSGLQMAGFLRNLREASLGCVTIDVGDSPPEGLEKALSPTLRNGQMYGWTRALAVTDGAGVARFAPAAEVVLIRNSALAAASTAAGERPVGAGLDAGFWGSGPGAATVPASALLFGELPHDATARVVVERGRELRALLQASGA